MRNSFFHLFIMFTYYHADIDNEIKQMIRQLATGLTTYILYKYFRTYYYMLAFIIILGGS